MNDLNQRLAALSPEQRALLERLKQKISPQSSASPSHSIPRRTIDDPLCLSPAQERLWFVQQMAPASAAYNIAIAWQFTGRLNPAAVRSSLAAIVQRHESLRTYVAVEQGQPVPQIDSRLSLALPIVDLRALTVDQQTAERDRIAQQEARQPFDLSQAPLMRATLIGQAAQTWTVLLTLHHLIADGWSRGVLLQEFVQNYRAIALGEAATFPDLPIQYSDYALWQRQTWQAAGVEPNRSLNHTASQTYWQQQLADLAMLELPTDYARPAMPSGNGDTVTATLPIALLHSVKAMARQAGVTGFMVLLAAFKLLLHRYTEQTDIAVGVPVANRDRPEIEGLIGFFVNTLVLRSPLHGDPSFSDWLKRVHQVTADAFAHQEMPFSHVVDLLQPDRHLSHNPLFQVMFQFQNQAYQLQNALNPELQLPDVTLTQTWRDLGSTKFDLTWHLIEQAEGIQVVVEYSTDLFRAETIARMVQHFQVLLEHVVRDPQQRLSQVPLLTPSEADQLAEWGCGAIDESLLTPWVHQRFEAQATQTPDAIAVVAGDQSLTYAALNHQANQLAHELILRGITAETLVGVYLERSPLLLIALLAVLKAGGAYVPLEVKLGSDRLGFMLADAQPWLILTTAPLAAQLPATAPIVCLERDRPLDQSDRNLNIPITGERLAYVIYTSGSTGTPKGTLLTHAGLANYLNWCCQEYAIAQGNGAPVQSAIGFDATITSLYAPLLVGRTVYLLPEADEIMALRDAIQTQPDLSFVKLTPAHLEALSYLLPNTANPHAPQAFIIGGEALTEHHLAFWRTYAPTTRLINEYGPTETVVGCCVYDAAIADTFQVPIGRPIANTQLYVLDRHLQPVPIGVPGELYIGGAGVARGYLNRPELTTERFIPHPKSGRGTLNRKTLNAEFMPPSPLQPFSDECATLANSASPLNPPSLGDFNSSSHQNWGARGAETAVGRGAGGEGKLYKTGDRVRWRSDGNLEYLGRLDHQIKLRGFRVEPGEVEVVLMQHSAIAQALVLCQIAPNQQPRLVAYLVAQVKQTVPTAAELRTFLTPKLPDYMQPSQWVWLDQMPLTANGKVDRAALPLPTLDAIATDQTAPQTEAEQALVEIWQELLGVPVGVHSNFFELGGDSILSLQMIARANQTGLHLTPKQLFQHQTIAELAALPHSTLNTQHSTLNTQHLKLKTQNSKLNSPHSPFPLTPIQQWLVEQNLHNLDYYNQAILLEVVPTLNSDYLRQALQQLWHHHDALRLRLIHTEKGWLQDYVEDSQPHLQPFSDECATLANSVSPLNPPSLGDFNSSSHQNWGARGAETGVIEIDLSNLPPSIQPVAITETATSLQSSLSLATGDLTRMALFRLGHNQSDRLLWIGHHWSVDGVSWRILLSDLALAYQQLDRNQPIQLPPKTTSLQTWAQQLVTVAHSDLMTAELDYWTQLAAIAVPRLPVDYPAPATMNTVATIDELSLSLDQEATLALLQDVPKAYRTRIDEVLLTALVESLAPWARSRQILVNLEHHGREAIGTELDVTRTVGWFTNLYPVVLELQNRDEPGANLKAIKEQLRRVPHHGLGYGLWRYLRKPPALPPLPQPEMRFNYLGQLDPQQLSHFSQGFAPESPGASQQAQNLRPHLLVLNSFMVDQQLQIRWQYSHRFHDRATIEQLAQSFMRSLQKIIRHCQSAESGGFTPSDVTAARLNQAQLDQFLTKIQAQKRS